MPKKDPKQKRAIRRMAKGAIAEAKRADKVKDLPKRQRRRTAKVLGQKTFREQWKVREASKAASKKPAAAAAGEVGAEKPAGG